MDTLKAILKLHGRKFNYAIWAGIISTILVPVAALVIAIIEHDYQLWIQALREVYLSLVNSILVFLGAGNILEHLINKWNGGKKG